MGFACGLPLLLTISVLQAWMREEGVDLTVIGAITSSPGLVLRKPDGQLYEAEHSGYEHFRWTGVEND